MANSMWNGKYGKEESARRANYDHKYADNSGGQKKDPMTHDSKGKPIEQWILDLVKRTTVKPKE